MFKSSLLQISLFTFACFASASNAMLRASYANAQVTSDGTTNTTINSDSNGNFTIEQGDRAGSNLFHSFNDFSVPTDGSAFFNNATDISNIFSRVTGGNISNIDGLIGNNGSANLFLINPAGILFGENARLDLGGSFYGSTADSVLFEDGEFSATDLENPPLLTVNAPIGLNLRDNPGDIINRSTANGVGLQVETGESISLIGGNINLEGGLITAPGGLVELGGLSVAGEIAIDEAGSFDFPEGVARSNVTLSDDAEVLVAGSGGGSIAINANNLLLTETSELIAGIAENTGLLATQAGDITIDATESIRIVGVSGVGDELQTGIRNNVGDRAVVRDESLTSNATGNGGSIIIDTRSLELEADGKVSTTTFGVGNAGDLNINANNISIDPGSIESLSRESAIGNSGNITITASDEIFLSDVDLSSGFDAAVIQTQVIGEAEGDVGNLKIDTGTLVLNEFSFILADAPDGTIGNAGNITIDASESITLNGELSLIISQIGEEGVGDAGEIRITAPNLSMSNSSLISTNVQRDSEGRTGNIFIDVDNLNIANGSVIDSLTENDFSGGNININANLIDLTDGGKIVTSSDSRGNAGSINLNVADTLTINNENPPNSEDSPFNEQILQNTVAEAGIFASTLESSTGDGGRINIQSGSIELINNGSISAVTQAGEGGEIVINAVDNIVLRNNNSISARAFNNANGGNLNIDADFIIAFPNRNNDILASSQQGQGGNITIDVESLLGIQQRPLSDLTNDINASSEFNLDGNIIINTLGIDPLQGAVELPQNVVEPEQTTAQACNVNRESGVQNSFVVKGRGGILSEPGLPLDSSNIIGADTSTTSAIPKPIETAQGKIQPARGIKVTEEGKIILTAYRTNNAGDRLPDKNLNCGV